MAVLITGASKGIGLATAKLLVAQNYQVVGIARNASENFPGDLYLGDLESEADTAKLLEKISENHQIDAIVNNVGLALPAPLGEIDLNSLLRVYQLNLRTAVQITQCFVSQMKQAKWGRIINIASRAIFGVKGRTSYAAAKSALVGCTRTWALELAEYGITVNAVAPGPVETDLFQQRHPKGSEAERAVLQRIPMDRLGQPEKIAAVIVFLISKEAAFITGQTICVDGGGSL